ncbi:MAG: hypothetical protein H8E66_13115 [Planctomycetes bacterium]|nr:hypothetical protein [Planctomycetota bacterium]
MNTHHEPQNSARGQRRWTGQQFRPLIFCLIGALLLQPLTIPASAHADNSEAASSLKTKLEKTGTIILRDASLVEWLFAIQREWGIDIVVGNELQAEVVNGAFTDTTLREVLNTILISRGFGYR